MKISEETVQEETPFFKLSLAQWSLHREVEKGELDPFDFPKVAKELGFEAVEWVDQLFAKQIIPWAHRSPLREKTTLTV